MSKWLYYYCHMNVNAVYTNSKQEHRSFLPQYFGIKVAVLIQIKCTRVSEVTLRQ